MTKQERKKAIIIFSIIALVFMVGSILTGGGGGEEESIQTVMRDAVMHDVNKVSLFGLKDVNPALISGFIVSGIMIIFALICRIFVIPRFKLVPGKFQLVLETVVGIFDGMAKSNSHINGFLGAYIFAAGSYIFTGTLFELLGVQVMTTGGHPISLPAPMADVNGAIMMGCLSYLVIMSGGIVGNGVKGIGPDLGSAGHRARLLLHGNELRCAGHSRSTVYTAPRTDPGIRTYHADITLLRRSIRKSRETAKREATRKKAQDCSKGTNCLTEISITLF